ncbi:hypothetical protein WJX84_004400 [Apatococcus fuscideae]|uniref:FAD-binding PCMH-type domain-containing protein n=1 Tax=Apatococcus fuscideae TaxID=2026836 RepID=A0AAW1RUE7_9CHLO
MGQDPEAAWPELDALRADFDGAVVLPSSGKPYSAACETWHLSPLLKAPRRPKVVLQPRGTRDVVTAVKFAKSSGLSLSVKSGGHSPNNACLSDGGITIDLGLMRSVYVDPEKRTAVAEGGCRLGDVDAETSLYSLAIPLGHAPITGMGLVLNGGIGVAGKVFGPASDHIDEVTVVTAEGDVVTASPTSHTELYWAMCGAGSAFGVATKIKLRLHDVSDCIGGQIMMPFSRDTLQAASHWLLSTGWRKKEFCCTQFVVRPPGAPQMIGLMIMYFGSESVDEKQAFLAPIRKLPLVQDNFGSMNYYQVQQSLKPMLSIVPGRREYATSGGFGIGQINAQLLDRVMDEILTQIPEPLQASIFTLDWWASEFISNSKAPIGFRNKQIGMLMLAAWYDEKHNDTGVSFAKYCKKTLESMHTDDGIYANADLITPDVVNDEGIAKRVGGHENLARLRAVKVEYDPTNLFRNHHFTGHFKDAKAPLILSILDFNVCQLGQQQQI